MHLTKLILSVSLAVLAASFTPSSAKAPSNQPLSLKMVDAHGLGDFDCNRRHMESLGTARWDYVTGLVADAVLHAYNQYPDRTDLLEAVKSYVDYNVSADGDTIYKGQVKVGGVRLQGLGQNNIDDIAAGKILFTLYDEAKAAGDEEAAARYKKTVTIIRNEVINYHVRIADGLPGAGVFIHKNFYPNQTWLDGLYMGSTIYALWQNHFGMDEGAEANRAAWDDIAFQFKTVHELTFDKEKQLNYHAFAADVDDPDAFWAQRDGEHKGCSPEFWARSIAWYFAALVETLEVMPTDHPDYQTILDNFKQVAAGIAARQDKETGLWFQLMQYDGTFHADGKGDVVDGQTYNVGTTANYVEASASAFFTYVFYKGTRLGLLDSETYSPVAERAFDGLLHSVIFFEKGKIGIGSICPSAGIGPKKMPSRTGTANFYLCNPDSEVVSNEGKGISAFIMAALEREKLQSK